MATPPRILIVDGYSPAGRDALQAGGASVAADLYKAMLTACAPEGSSFDVYFPADGPAGPPDDVRAYDAVAWTGSSLSINDPTPEVRRQIELAQRCYASGVPAFGSCWAAQVAVVSAGGKVQPNPHGREAGVARKIQLTPEGRAHPMYDGKASVFDGYTSHDDEITHLPPGAVVLSRNSWTLVQSVCVTHKGTTFWALQYHPEYDLHEIARLTSCRIPLLMRQGIFRSEADARSYIDLLETLYLDPSRKDIAWLLGLDADVMSEDVRWVEVRNWLQARVLPDLRRRAG